jgi:hypothetical protein
MAACRPAFEPSGVVERVDGPTLTGLMFRVPEL